MLEGIKVLSFTHFLQGPAAVQMLADVGAGVIKIEPPGGAFERSWTGFDAYVEGVSMFFLLGNRNQRSISLDLRDERAREIVWRLIKEADVLIENYRPGVLQRMGFGYDDVREINPRLVYCSCTGYGSSGPYLKRPGQDLLLQAISGMTMLSGEADSPPTPVGSAIVDQHAAALAAFGVVAALQARERTGKGTLVESNLLNAALDLQIEPFTYYLNKGPLWPRTNPPTGSRFHPSPYGVYRTLDGWIAVSLTPTEKLAAALSQPVLAGFSHPKDNVRRRDELNRIVYDALTARTTADWMTTFDEHDIWYAPVNDYHQVEADPQVAHNRIIMEVEHPQAEPIRLLAHPVRYDGAAPPLTRQPPRQGEHTREVLAELGYEPDEIDTLVEAGAALTGRRTA
ncbi:crotonobetainyl-CoA:carnitine CoA-transferase CaiB-like acyl-CoA transferase [Paraburkholderia sp. HC6.4b]|uniref:CaiB/BaiF CoA transferase family protein n=1 Tax=unclassified Paraburkholderia TaxID=2615204 RepID=UPI00161EBE5A|nr:MULTISPECIES: CaiB/BaiF CoA-transferase family protein [unclassified Paraburkholderia]MBB5412780.1 crotonobetainyl-CoA:carnitine CoA-transferase CaiB-like acyl-CoA transferase [Paraburkholderia sp. HC6.4b]MBB5454845.1 crotonobetainyl-CoA:carnitine CoA-transferase CaiB-like acyl-CoA transferase [Paraburkholderia sp. Kb1A]